MNKHVRMNEVNNSYDDVDVIHAPRIRQEPPSLIEAKSGQVMMMIDGKPTWRNPPVIKPRIPWTAIGYGLLHGSLIVVAGALVVTVVLFATLVLSW